MKNYTLKLSLSVFSLWMPNFLFAQQLGSVDRPFVKAINAPGVFQYSTASILSDLNEYNPRGAFTKEYTDRDADGQADDIISYTYDANGNLTKKEYDYGANDTINSIRLFTYDANGNQTKEEEDWDADGQIDNIRSYTYDADGNLTKTERDNNADGMIDFIILYSYDASGNQTKREEDNDANGVFDNIINSTYDVNGNQTREENDQDGDGAIDRILKITYNTDGNLTKREEDNNADGIMDRIFTFMYNKDGNMIRYEEDIDGDGSADVIITYVYNDDGLIISGENDTDGDGQAEETLSIDYDAFGNLISVESFRNDTLINRTDRSYDINNNLVKSKIDNDGNDTLDRITTFSYFNPISCSSLGDGLAHKFEVNIPRNGNWRFELCGSAFQNVFALSSNQNCDSNLFYAIDGCSSGDASADIRLDSGMYYLTIAGKGLTDKGDYTLDIKRIPGLSVPFIDNSSISIYPNPAKDRITVNYTNARIESYTIINTFGQSVSSGLLNNHTIDIELLPKGSYILSLIVQGGVNTFYKRFVK